MAEMKMPRFMISATGSGCGKTTITCGILKALMNKGLKVAAFKSGPDYIDPMFHSKVIGAKSRNLDVFMLGKETVRFLAAKNACDVEVSVFEGAMGFYDGMGKTAEASAYDLACTCDVPVVLVVNGKGAALSVAAQIKGFKEFRKDSHIVGAILNNVNPMSYAYYKEVIEAESGVKLLGYFPVLENCNFESRHLGLVTAEEIGDLQAIVERLALQAEKSLDLEGLLEIAQEAPALEYTPQNVEALGKVKLAVAQDKAFCFYYQDALDLLTELGAELVPFSPINDKHLPECDGLVLGGGYPELYAKQLAENTVPPKSKTADGLKYSVNQEKYLKVFLEDGNVPIDNSASERAIKTFCLGKKNWMFHNTVNGAQASAVIYSISETAKLNELRPYYYFKHLLTELPKLCDETGNIDSEKLDTLLPWSKELPEECRKPRR